jgi:hypothetical protein
MRDLTVEQLKTMDKDQIRVEIGNRIYEAAILFERLESAGAIRGNGHHIAQAIALHAQEVFDERWVLGETVSLPTPVDV